MTGSLRSLNRSQVRIDADAARLDGELAVPDDASGLVVFAHGSGSTRHSPRNAFVAEMMNNGHLATLLFDLLTPKEASISCEPPRVRDRLGECAAGHTVPETRRVRREHGRRGGAGRRG